MKQIAEVSSLFQNIRAMKQPNNSHLGVQYSDTYLFKYNEKKLVFVAGTHKSNDQESVNILNKVFSLIHPQKLLLEIPNDQDKNGILNNLNRMEQTHRNEFYTAIDLAIKLNIDFSFVDLSEVDNLRFFLDFVDDGFEVYLLELFSIIYRSFVNTYFHERKFPLEDYFEFAKAQLLLDVMQKSTLQVEFDKIRTTRYKGLSPLIALDEIIKSVAEKYIGSGYTSPDLIMAGEITAPFPYVKKYKINEINTWYEAVRDYHMAETIIKNMKRNDSIVMVGGSGHAYIMKDYLCNKIKEKFGGCEIVNIMDL